MTGLFDQFRDEESGSGGEMGEERPPDAEQNNESVIQETEEEHQTGSEETAPQTEYSTTESNENIGISSLMNKRAKLEEAVDYVGGLISQLKEKRTSLEKEIEDESVDIKNLKEKLIKVSEYISEETQGIQQLSD